MSVKIYVRIPVFVEKVNGVVSWHTSCTSSQADDDPYDVASRLLASVRPDEAAHVVWVHAEVPVPSPTCHAQGQACRVDKP